MQRGRGWGRGPPRNDFVSPPARRFDGLHAWLDEIADLGATMVQLGPVWESTTHGYDTADYFTVDRRLGDATALMRWSEALHRRGLRLVLDGVFHHVGRDFWAFRDVRGRGAASPYRDWFMLDFDGRSPYGDPFSYQGWRGHYDLVKLNLGNTAVRQHLFAAVRHWVTACGVDGLRLDAADVLDLDFQRELAAVCRSLRPDFWLMGEVVYGDYRRWANPATLDTVTNYELYKALYSSHNDRSYFEVAHALSRQSGEARGLYRDLALATFADNHDVDRVASRLADPRTCIRSTRCCSPRRACRASTTAASGASTDARRREPMHRSVRRWPPPTYAATPHGPRCGTPSSARSACAAGIRRCAGATTSSSTLRTSSSPFCAPRTRSGSSLP